MKKFIVRIEETQYWVYEFEVNAESAEAAQEIGQHRFYDGEQPNDSYVSDSTLTSATSKEITE
jgi:hypothetical protein